MLWVALGTMRDTTVHRAIRDQFSTEFTGATGGTRVTGGTAVTEVTQGSQRH